MTVGRGKKKKKRQYQNTHVHWPLAGVDSDSQMCHLWMKLQISLGVEPHCYVSSTNTMFDVRPLDKTETEIKKKKKKNKKERNGAH